MNSKDIKGLYEAYSAVYDEDLRDELEEMSDEFAGIEELTDEEIDAIVEETIDEMIEEGYDFDEVEEIFEEVISEAKVTFGGETRGGSAKVTTGAGSRMAAASRLSGMKEKKRAEKVAQVKASVKKKVAQVKAAPGEAKKAVQQKVKDVKRQAHVGAAKYASGRGLMRGAGLKTQSSKGRAELRSAVAKDIKGRIKHKIAKAQVGAYSAARQAGQAASDVAGKTKQSAKYTAARTKRGVKGAIGAVASKVASGASKLASRMATEEVDVYDIVLEHLVVEGYADTLESAEAIMANMSEDWRQEIVEAAYSAKAARAGKDIGKPGKQFEKIAKEAGKRYGSKERGEKVAGAVLANIRAKHGA